MEMQILEDDEEITEFLKAIREDKAFVLHTSTAAAVVHDALVIMEDVLLPYVHERHGDKWYLTAALNAVTNRVMFMFNYNGDYDEVKGNHPNIVMIGNNLSHTMAELLVVLQNPENYHLNYTEYTEINTNSSGLSGSAS